MIQGAVWSTTSPNPILMERPMVPRTPAPAVSSSASFCGNDRLGIPGLSLATNHPTLNATITAPSTRTTVMVPPSRGIERKMASRPSSGVATRNAMAAVIGAPRLIRVR